MLIQVVYVDNRFDYVKAFNLEALINSKRLKKFRRRTGWVSVDVGPLRGSNRGIFFTGQERRQGNALPFNHLKFT